MTWLLGVFVDLVGAVDVVTATGDVWGPALLGAGLAVAGWRMRPRGGRHRTPSARWSSARTTTRTVMRTVAGTVRTAASALVHPKTDDRPPFADEPPVSSADGRPAGPADGRPPQRGRDDGSD